MGVIQREIERAGVSTVSISLVREFTEQVLPPRALWVPFPFGRPLGAPGEPEVQRRVLDAALSLLDRAEGPVLEAHELTEDEEHHDARWQTIGRSCGPRGCNLAPEPDAESADSEVRTVGPPDGDVAIADVRAELAELAPAHLEYRRTHDGRTQVGESGFEPDEIVGALEILHRYADGTEVRPPDGVEPVELYVRRCIDDLKAYYTEARLGGGEAQQAAHEVNDWLWTETEMSRLMVAVRDRILATMDTDRDPNSVLARGIVPRGYGESGYSLAHTSRLQAGDGG